MNKLSKNKNFILGWLKSHKYCVISTSTKDKPWAATVNYHVDDNFNIYISSNPKSMKCKNLKENPIVCLVVDSQNREGTLQLQGTAQTVSPEEHKGANVVIEPNFLIYRTKAPKGKQKVYLRIHKIKKTVSVIVPAFNEEKTIKGVIETLQKSSLLNEIICVNDGSTDSTEDVLKQYKNSVLVINLKKNQGKGHALAQGIKKAKGDIVMFLDADLTTLSERHIQSLLQPLFENTHKAVMGYLVGKSRIAAFPAITGQRTYYKKDLMPYLEEISKTRYGVEIFLNTLFSKKDTKKIPLPGLQGLYKYEKHNATTALTEYIKEGIEIAKVIGNKEVLPNSDFKILKNISNLTNLNDLRDKIEKITDIKIKDILEKYLKYIRIVTEKSNK